MKNITKMVVVHSQSLPAEREGRKGEGGQARRACGTKAKRWKCREVETSQPLWREREIRCERELTVSFCPN